MTWADGLKDQVRSSSLAAATLAATELRQQLREDTPKRTGRTSRGWYVTGPYVDGDGIEFHLQHPQGPDDPPDVEWLNSGTRPHVINARRARFLAFPGEYVSGPVVPTRTGGGMVFVKSVNHPGTDGTGFIDRILGQANVADVVGRALAAS